ncbi:MAG: type I secretion system permease/ATPase, partial [Desulfuromonadales bacterium]|nr:type I secretion system permease/ATPase [Desulfuromonadales bacterium]
MITGLIAFEVVARINRVDVDSRAILREFGLQQEVTPEELLRIAKHYAFKAKRKAISLERVIAAYPLPAIVVLKTG